ncbi:hypothetical protein NHX12_006038 [Muraenolepis orangiensis]|uniref:Cyclin-dependent kinase inhibitor domain-containing protein n=1 Tax=Muraenolepis orangiensis TaxID=630683 RepID=A0A9Q0DQB6_9TELE|nr:hypothetical protein NHX12_006038 [Muraenolepis orangiensis]
MTRTMEGPITTPHLGGVCRKLFGPVDHDQLSRDLSRQLEDMAEQDRRRWNFSFETNEPLPGKYQWETIPSDRSACFYQESTCGAGKDAATEDTTVQSRLEEEDGETKACLAETNRENCSSVSNTLKYPCETTPVRRKRTSAHMTAPQNNTHITDFFVKRRRSADTRPLSSLSFPSEQALCKGLR